MEMPIKRKKKIFINENEKKKKRWVSHERVQLVISHVVKFLEPLTHKWVKVFQLKPHQKRTRLPLCGIFVYKV